LPCEPLRAFEYIVRNGYRSLHTISITTGSPDGHR
jgi:hypothetical protein